MQKLVLEPNFSNPDDFYAELLEAHRGLDEDATHALNARLVLILANHIGDTALLRQALEAASKTRPRPDKS